MQTFNPLLYWSDKSTKKWVVTIKGNGRKRPSDQKIVSATTMEGAIITAKFHTILKGRVSCTARLAWPSDLGIMQAGGIYFGE